jgi:formylglycine-generating enzyme required for sulfatase activity
MKIKPPLLTALLFILACNHGASAQSVINVGIVSAGRQVYLFWPSGDTNYVLQRAATATSTNWVTVTGQTQLTGVCLTNTSATGFFRLYMNTNIPAGMQQIPGGTFVMGDTLDGESDAALTDVTVSPYYMDINLVSYSQWQAVYAWAAGHGYNFVDAGLGKATNYPVETVDWYDAVKWCNARSQQAGQTPVYYTEASFTHVYTNGEVTPYPNWSASGFRLPTEAEWEMAARGGLVGQRFPWGDTISCLTEANIDGFPGELVYDVGALGQNPFFTATGVPFTSPVAFYPANGFGLYDMAGNVDEWCWDWYGTPYAAQTNPHGPATGTYRVTRGGDWGHSAAAARCAARESDAPTFITTDIGFRCVKGL